jgi:hypothetical protein
MNRRLIEGWTGIAPTTVRAMPVWTRFRQALRCRRHQVATAATHIAMRR